jgi:Tfp pilus assembly protein FimV
LFALNCFLALAAQAQTTQFTYRGRLTDTNASANGSYDFQFALYDAATGGAQQGSTQLCRNANKEISTCSSSLRYKTNIAPFSFGLNFVNQLKPISFDWKDGGMKDIGFAAEDVASINPLFVTYNSKGEVEGVKYDRLSVAFVNAFKEQQAQIQEQQKRINEQQKQIDQQQKRLNEQQAAIDGLKKLVCLQNPQAKICKEAKRK